MMMTTAPFVSRTESAQYRLYEFAKTALIKIFATPYAAVCDFYCGGGVDTDKWNDAQIGHYVGIDASTTGITEARELWESQTKPYTAEFCELDPCTSFVSKLDRGYLTMYSRHLRENSWVTLPQENLETYLQDKGVPVDIVCCMQHLQLCFETEERARSLLQNVSSLLKPGGYFFGITPDSSTIWAKYQKVVEASHNKGAGMKPNPVANCIRSENYIITFEVEEEKFPFFGKKYQLKFTNDVAAETYNLVHFPSLIRLAREAGLEYVEIQNLTEFYEDNRAQFAGLLHTFGPNLIDPRGKLLARSFDILGLYSTFIFQKPNPDFVLPVTTPPVVDVSHIEDREWHSSGRRPQASVDDEKNGHLDITLPPVDSGKGILGPGPADQRFPDFY